MSGAPQILGLLGNGDLFRGIVIADPDGMKVTVTWTKVSEKKA
jgi:hypothetical protein